MVGRGGKAACLGSIDRALGFGIAAAVAVDAVVGLICATCLLRVPLRQLRWPHLDDRAGGSRLR